MTVLQEKPVTNICFANLKEEAALTHVLSILIQTPVGGNGYTRANGGLASGIISYEFDIRLQTVSGYDNMTGDNRGEFVVYGWKNGTDGTVAGGKKS